MLHLRILTPTTLRTAVLDILDADPGVVHLSVTRGAALIEGDPGPAASAGRDGVERGDLVEADLQFASLAGLLDRLEELGVIRGGAVSVTELEVARSTAADRSTRRLASAGEELISFEQVSARTSEDVSLSLASAILMAAAGLIAATGLVTNNEILIVGAMIVSPDFGPLAGTIVALVGGRRREARRSAVSLVLGFAIAAATAFVATALARFFGLIPEAYAAGVRPVAELISTPGLSSILVAMTAGVAGMIALGQAKSGAVVGVLVSVTTIPAAANVGVALANGELNEALGSLLQLAVNLLGMMVAGILTLLGAQRLSARRARATDTLPPLHRPGVVSRLFSRDE